MDLPSLLSVTPIYVGILGLLFVPMTVRAGLYRVKSNILIGTGEDPEMLRRMRGQANFTETVPMALFLLITMELLGATNIWLHSLGSLLVVGRAAHYLGLTELGPVFLRAVGMGATLLTILIGAIWILVNVL
jgi:uncharacterized membrane protein YecN with MAPEG domain